MDIIDHTIANAPVRDYPNGWWNVENDVWYRCASGSLDYYRDGYPLARVLREGARHWVPVIRGVRGGRFTTRRKAIAVVAQRVAYRKTIE